MSLFLGGMGWVTPLGADISHVWQRLLDGEEAKPETIASDLHSGAYPVFRVPPEVAAEAPPHPRLRRSSAISRFAAIAGLAALRNAGIQLDAESAGRTAIVFAISNGGVVYTKRFYHDVVAAGPQAASPLLFPETVFNAPSSHLAAILGITGASYTLVGDGAVGLLALKMAEDLMQNPALDRCLVVGAEEVDWLSCDAYHRWRLLRRTPPLEVFALKKGGTILSEGAGAVLVARGGRTKFETIDAGCNFSRQTEAAACVDRTFARLRATNQDAVIASANGTFLDAAESAAVLHHCPRSIIYALKAALGESVGAGALWQVICAAQSLETQQLPPIPRAPKGSPLRLSNRRGGHLQISRTIVSSCGMNQQVAGLSLRRAD